MSYHEKSGTELLAPLNVDPDRPSRVDIAAAMTTGRRKRRLGLAAAGAAVVALAGGTAVGGTLAFDGPGPDPAPERLPACVATPLPMGGYKTIQVTGSDPTGRYVAGRANPVADMRSTVVVWHDNRIARIVKKDRLELTDFTTKGVGVGYEVDGTRAYVYTDGTLTPLKGDRLTADAINEAGVIVGTSAGRPVRWASATADPEPLPLPAGTAQGVVSGLAEDGTIVGRVDLDIGYLWLPDGTHRPIAAPEIDGVPARGFVPVELRNGWIYGDAMVPVDTGGIEATAMRPFRYQLATGRYERLAKQDGTPSFYLGSRLVPLPGDPSVSGRTSYAVTAVSDDNRALAGDSNASSGGAFLPVSWRCEEE